jgi:NAD-dependent SIR2 family protein deacetylase
MEWIRVTPDNYENRVEMYCEKCGEQWDFATYEIDIDMKTNKEIKIPTSPCCGKYLVKKGN